MTVPSGGGNQVAGPYVLCNTCRVEFRINYKTGEVDTKKPQKVDS